MQSPVPVEIPGHAGCTQLGSSFVEKNLGVLVDIKLNMNHQCAFIVKSANDILCCFRQSIDSRSKEQVSTLIISVEASL